MFKKTLLSLAVVMALTACSSDDEYENPEGLITDEELDQMINSEETDDFVNEKSSESTTSEAEEEPAEPEIEAVEEPPGNMEDWVHYTYKQRVDVINKSLEYEKYDQESKGSKVEIIGTVDDFISVLDNRYEEIDNSDDQAEYYRMMNASIASQVSIMGHQMNLINFVYSN